MAPNLSGQNDAPVKVCFPKELASKYSGSLKKTPTKLTEMVFTENRFVAVTEWIAKQPPTLLDADHQALMRLAQQYLFLYNFFINDNLANYPYKETKCTDEWFSVPINRQQESDSEAGSNIIADVQVLNTDKDNVRGKIRDKIKELSVEEKYVYFHGTNYEGAKSIVEDAIELERGSTRCDFSNGGNSFYLTDSYDYAVDWALNKKKIGAAVVMFTVTNECLAPYKGLDLSSNTEKNNWKKVIEYYRKGKPRTEPINGLNKHPYIRGPISRDGTNNNLNPQQLCIKNDKLAEAVGTIENICGVVFF